MAHDLGTPVPVRAPRGTTRTALGWPQEAALRMLQNNLDPEVAEHPDSLVVYGGTGRAARDWPSFHALVRTLTTLRDDETMLVQSGKPVGVMRTHEWAPRVLIANSNLVGDWATWPEFRRLESLGLTMYGQMTAGSWIYIGTQGIVQGTYETFAAVAAKRFGGTLAGTLTLTAGCGGMGGAQPLAVTMNEGACLIVDVDATRLARRVEHRYLDEWTDDLDVAVEKALAAKAERRGHSVGVVGNAAEVLPELLRRGVRRRHRHRPDLRPRPAGLLPDRGQRRGVARPGGRRSGGLHHPRARVDGHARRGDGRVHGRRRRGVRLRQLDPRGGRAGRLHPGLRLPRVRAGLHPPAVLRGQGPVPLGRPLRGPGATSPPPTPRSSTCSPTTSRWSAGSARPGSGSPTRACRRGSAGWARASAPRPA